MRRKTKARVAQFTHQKASPTALGNVVGLARLLAGVSYGARRHVQPRASIGSRRTRAIAAIRGGWRRRAVVVVAALDALPRLYVAAWQRGVRALCILRALNTVAVAASGAPSALGIRRALQASVIVHLAVRRGGRAIGIRRAFDASAVGGVADGAVVRVAGAVAVRPALTASTRAEIANRASRC